MDIWNWKLWRKFHAGDIYLLEKAEELQNRALQGEANTPEYQADLADFKRRMENYKRNLSPVVRLLAELIACGTSLRVRFAVRWRRIFRKVKA